MAMRIEPGRGRIDLKVFAAVALVALAGAAIVGWLFDGAGRSDLAGEIARAVPGGMPAASAGSRTQGGEGGADAGRAALVAASDAAASTPMTAAALAPVPGAERGVPAAWSLADSLVSGDDRAPPIQRSAQDPAAPAWQLDDHQAYARREQDRQQSVRQAFVDAAERELPLLDQQIEQGRAMGLSPEQLAKGEEKRRRIAEMRSRMQAALGASGPAP